MYEYDTGRVITLYIKSQAYVWLYEKIRLSEYCFGCGKAPADIYNRIIGQGYMTGEDYRQFISLFDNNPFKNLILGGKDCDAQTARSDNGIDASNRGDISLYFIRYNGEILPIGFITSFFEDEFNSEKTVYALRRNFCDNAKQETASEWNRIRYMGRNTLARVRREMAPVLSSVTKNIITELLITVCIIFIIAEFILFLSDYKVIDAMIGYIDSGYLDSAVIGESAQLLSLSDGTVHTLTNYTITEYMDTVGTAITVNLILITALILIICLSYVREIKYVNKCYNMKLQMKQHERYSRVLEDNGVQYVEQLCDRLIKTVNAPGGCRGLTAPPESLMYIKYTALNTNGYDGYLDLVSQGKKQKKEFIPQTGRLRLLPYFTLFFMMSVTDIKFILNILFLIISTIFNR